MQKNKSKKLIKKLRSLTVVTAFFGLVKKNLKLILRSKSSSTIFFLGPLIIVFLVSAAFNTSSLFNIKIGTYSDSYSELSESLLKDLGDKQFVIEKIASKEKCLDDLKNNLIHVCAIIPQNLQVGSAGNVEFFVDNSKINLVWTIIDAVSKKVSTKSTELSEQLASNLLSVISKTESELNPKIQTANTIAYTNKNLETKFSQASTQLNSLDLSFTVGKIGVDKISNKLDKIIDDNNFNESLFGEVNKAILDSIDVAEDYEKTMKDATTIKDNILASLSDANLLLAQNAQGAKDIENAITTISSDISKVKATSAESIATPIKLAINPISTKTTNINFLFPTLVVLIIMFIGLLLSSILIVREKLSSAYFRNFITPTHDFVFIISDYVTNLIILFLQLVIIFGVGLYFFRENLLSILLKTSISIFLLSTFFIFVGMLLGYLFRSEETVVLAAFSLGILFLFLSGTILPLETLPESIKQIADFNPFVLGESLLKKIMLFNLSFSDLGSTLYILLAYILVSFIAVYYARKLSKRYI
ncbi:ABC transporter permease [Candidatus Woesearchaeota archaeon]|nr:ABC transporter permease [Candidatus Woesearchaeota archaeon]